MKLPQLFARRAKLILGLCVLCLGMMASEYGFSKADDISFSDEQIEFFESKIRPLLAENCYSCHSGKAEKLQARLLLDSRASLMAGGESGAAIVAGKPDDSLLIKSVKYDGFEMPPDRKLSNEQVALLAKWVEMGAPWPKSVDLPNTPKSNAKWDSVDWEKVRTEHWAWKPIRTPDIPNVVNQDWPRTPIDRFVLASLEQAGLSPSPPAEPHILLRRMYLDLVGVPPTIEQVDAFVSLASSDYAAAVQQKLDELLSSPLYGQRWARHWLDVARYSDGFGGFLDSAEYRHAWRYRDWVINAFNSDMAWDDFLKLQIAGDLIGQPADMVATGYFALGPTYNSDGGDPDSISQAKSETLDDRIDTLSRGMLGVTVSCARCHDHKFDPVPQQDYYSLAGVFNNTSEQERIIADQATTNTFNELRTQMAELDKQIDAAKAAATKDNKQPSTEEQQAIDALNARRDAIAREPVLKTDQAHVLAETGSSDMKVALRGNLRNPGEEAPRRFLRLVSGANPKRFTDGSGRRELAEQIVAPENPLTARVFVNRIWMHHFGEAIVRTPSNFGILGQLPTHPDLLDWLASQLIDGCVISASNTNRQSLSIKSLHRLIMSSAAYQMSSQLDQRAFDLDGDNRLIWRMSPRRMDVEAWRDSLLAVTGESDYSFGLPSIEDLANTKRRTVYAKVSRNGDQFASDVFLRTFDFPMMRATVENRPKSIVPQQYLFLMNSQFIVDRARALVNRLQSMADSDPQRIELAYRLLYSRLPTTWELQRGLEFVSKSAEDRSQTDNGVLLSRWVGYAQVLLSANEFMYVR